MKSFLYFISCFLLFLGLANALVPSADVKLIPNTENSPSLYLFQFTLSKALPANSYILITMDWYSSNLNPYKCTFVNTSISAACTNLAVPTFPLTISTTQITKFNSLLPTTKTIAVLVGSNLAVNTVYALQLHLYNVVSAIRKISPSIEMYTVSANGLIYESNSNFGAVVNNPPNTQMMSVTILNDLSANNPGAVSTLKVEVQISQAVSTALSTFIFVMQTPF